VANEDTRMRRAATIALGLFLAVCLMSAIGGLAFVLWPGGVTRPLVLIESPRDGESVTMGDRVIVQAVARDQEKITRVELWVEGQLIEAQTSSLPGGVSPFPLLGQWRPVSSGTHRLIVRAFNSQGARAHASVEVQADVELDGDGDGVADDDDLCPDELGSPAANGCADQDGDAIADIYDSCPEEAGLAEVEGCPSPSQGDGDGDGVRDQLDACPDQAGSPVVEGCPDADWDGVMDREDACPDEAGVAEQDGCPPPGDLDNDGVPDLEDECAWDRGRPEQAGCPDSDGDGLRDVDDACVDEPGVWALAGCPDRDGDGVPDREDLSPNEPGPRERHGAPDTGAPDSDADGVADDADFCDGEEGLPEHVGCPPPGEAEDTDGDGIADDEELPDVPLSHLYAGALQRLAVGPGQSVPFVLTRLQFEFLSFSTSGDFMSIACYTYDYQHYDTATGELPIIRYGPYALEGNSWNIAEILGGANSFYFRWDTEDALPFFMECEGFTETRGFDLGETRWEHPSGVWTGDDVRPPRSLGGDLGHWFEVTYRICPLSCELAALEPPTIVAHVLGGNLGVAWEWEGQEGLIDGFAVYVDGVRQGIAPPDARVTYIDFDPACGESYDLYMTAYRAAPMEDESPPSNTVDLEGIECPRTVRVTFQALHTYTLPQDEERDGLLGPLFGHFRANGANIAFDYEYHDAQQFGGWWLRNNRDYSIAEYFRGCRDSPEHYYCPDLNFVDVDLGPYDDLTLEAAIYETDGWPRYGYHTVLEGELRLRPWEIDVGAYTIEDERHDADVTVVLGTWGD
jgi:hypothetical protein